MMRWEFYSFVLLGLFSGHFLNARLVTISSCYGLATYIIYCSAAAALDFHRPCDSMNDEGSASAAAAAGGLFKNERYE